MFNALMLISLVPLNGLHLAVVGEENMVHRHFRKAFQQLSARPF
jgi:hypothetical protein